MSRIYVPLSAGLQDVGGEDGLELPRWFLFQNWRVGPDGSISRRKGCQRFGRVASLNVAYDFDGTNHWVSVNLDSRIHTLKRYWTLDALVKPSSFATNSKTILGVAHAANYSLKIYFTTAGKLEAKVQDSAGTVVTLTSTSTFSTGTIYATQVVRDGTSLYMRVNGTLEDSDTCADLDGLAPGGNLYIGRDNTLNAFQGIIDNARLLNLVLPDQRYGFIRWPYPMEDAVLFDYHEEEVTGHMVDHSRFENHGIAAGAPTAATANALCVPHMPVFGMTSWLDRNAKQQFFAQTGNGYVQQEMTK